MRKKAISFLNDFKAFAIRGNVMDLAVGIIIGGAFGKITASLVGDIIMPLIGLLIGGFNFKEWKYALPDNWGSTPEGPATLNVGLFVQSVVDFTIIAFCVFIMIRLITKLQKKKDEAPPEPDERVLLLREIRDLLSEKAAGASGHGGNGNEAD